MMLRERCWGKFSLYSDVRSLWPRSYALNMYASLEASLLSEHVKRSLQKSHPDSHREHSELRLIINQDSVLRPIILIDQPTDIKGF